MSFLNFSPWSSWRGVAVASLGMVAVACSYVAGAPTVASAQELVGMTACDYDNDSQVDAIRLARRTAFVTLSSNPGSEKRIRLVSDHPALTCVDTDKDNKDELWGLNKNGKRVKRYDVVRSSVANGLSKVCSKVRELQRCEIYKTKQSTHISKGDPRHRSTGFITTRGCPGTWGGTIIAFDKTGAEIHRMGEYSPTGSAYDGRHYGCHGAGDCKSPLEIVKDARRAHGTDEIWLRNEQRECVRIPDAGVCWNSQGC
jgi:hypothetical protein